jgi:hypothetical protein
LVPFMESRRGRVCTVSGEADARRRCLGELLAAFRPYVKV